MKRTTLFILSVMAIIVGVSTVQAADFKVAFVNAAVLLDKAPQAEAARKKLENEFSAREKELIAQQKKVQEMENKLSRDAATMSDTEQRKLDRELTSRKRELKNSQDEFRDDLNIRRNEELGKLQRSVYEVIVALAKQEKYDMIVGDGVIYASEQVDITDKVLQQLKSAGVK